MLIWFSSSCNVWTQWRSCQIRVLLKSWLWFQCSAGGLYTNFNNQSLFTQQQIHTTHSQETQPKTFPKPIYSYRWVTTQTTAHCYYLMLSRAPQLPIFWSTSQKATKDSLHAHNILHIMMKHIFCPVSLSSCLIAMALKNSKTGSLPVSEIYSFMKEHFPYFKVRLYRALYWVCGWNWALNMMDGAEQWLWFFGFYFSVMARRHQTAGRTLCATTCLWINVLRKWRTRWAALRGRAACGLWTRPRSRRWRRRCRNGSVKTWRLSDAAWPTQVCIYVAPDGGVCVIRRDNGFDLTVNNLNLWHVHHQMN